MLSLGKINFFRKRKLGRGNIAKKQKESFARSLAASSIFVGLMMVFYNFYPVFASPPSTPYTPGETTDPSCSPGDTNCTVYSPLTTTLTTSTAIIMGTSSLRFAYDSTNYTSFSVSSDGSLAIATSSGANLLRIVANGNIGIGTSTPAERLSVVGNISNVIDASTTMAQVGGLTLGGTPYAIAVSGKYAYIVQYDSSTMAVVDISNPLSPVLISTSSAGQNPMGITVSGKYAYVANYMDSNMTSTISVMDISNPVSPRRVAFVSSSRSLFLTVSGNYLYATGYHSSNFDVFDISNPLSPVQVSQINMPVPLNSLLGGVFVSGRYAYVAGGHSISLKGKFLIFDVADPTHPSLVTTTLFGDFYSVYVSGRYAYLSNYASNTMAIMDVSNPNAPVQVATTSVGTGPQSITVSGRYAFVSNVDSNNVSVVDISSSTAPKLIKNISVGSYPVSLYVSGRYLYVINAVDSSLSVIDISGTEVTSLVAHSAEVGNLHVRNDIFAQGNIMAGTSLVVGSGGIMSQGSLSIFASSTGATTSIFSINSAQRSNILKIMANGNVGIGTSTPSQKLSVVGSISNIIDSGAGVSQIATTSVGVAPISVFVSGRYAYTADYTSGTISVVDISNPLAPARVGSATVGDTPYAVAVSGNYAYVTTFLPDSLAVVDISNPSAPRQVASTSLDTTPSSYTSPTGIFISGKYAYIAEFGTNELTVVDISNPLIPIKIGATVISKDPISIYAQGRYAYTANNDASSMSVIDVLNPSAPVELATTSVGLNPSGIFASGRYVYVVNQGSSSLHVVDVSNPRSPIKVSTTTVGALPTSVFVSGRYAYITNDSAATLTIVDVSVPTSPVVVATTTVGANPFSVFVSGRYAYVANSGSDNISVVDISGTEVSSLMAHSAEVGNIQSRNDIFAAGNIMAGTSLVVGAGGIMSQGALSVFTSSTGSTSSLFNISSAQSSNILKVYPNGTISIGTSTVSSYKLYIDAGVSTTAGLAVNGFIKATGYITGSTTLDIAETYPLDPECDAKGTCPQVGDVVCVAEDKTDGQSSFFIEKCSAASADNILGVVSGNPGFILGGYEVNDLKIKGLFPTSFMPVALGGRVPVKVSTINGPIKAGDYLTSSAVPGVAVKAIDSGKSIGVALGSFDGSVSTEGTVLVFVNNIWVPGSPVALSEDQESQMPDFAQVVLDKFTLSIKNSLRKLGLIVKNGVATVKELFADKISTHELCVGSTCVNESQLRELLQQTNSSAGGSSGNGVIIESPPEPVVEDVPIPTTTPSSSAPEIIEAVVDLSVSTKQGVLIEISSSSAP